MESGKVRSLPKVLSPARFGAYPKECSTARLIIVIFLSGKLSWKSKFRSKVFHNFSKVGRYTKKTTSFCCYEMVSLTLLKQEIVSVTIRHLSPSLMFPN